MKKPLILTIISLFLFIVDRLIKYLILKTPNQGLFLTKNIGIKLYLNQGLAFSLPLPNFINIILAALIIFILIGLLIKYYQANFSFLLALTLIIIGATSNLIDRIRFNAVIDLFSFFFWPAFNLADCYIIVGIILFFLTFKHYSLVASKTVTNDSGLRQVSSK
jgi:signal peptidase II